MSTTATDKERLYNSYLEKYITQTIEAQSAVKSAKVHLSFPKDNGTLAAQKEEASAFIQLELTALFTSANAAALAKCGYLAAQRYYGEYHYYGYRFQPAVCRWR